MGLNQLRVPRDPSQERRLARFTEIVSAILNSGIDGGTIQQVGPGGSGGPGSWGFTGLLFSGNGPPGATVGYTGDYYLDLTGGVLYHKV